MPVFLTPEQLAARNKRSLWIALGLIGFIVLIFTTTFLRMRENIALSAAEKAAVATAPAPVVPAPVAPAVASVAAPAPIIVEEAR